jgi:hypothetical protein
MKNLTDKITFKLNERMSVGARKKRAPVSKEVRDIAVIRSIIKLIKTGDFDRNNKYHRLGYSLAVKKGFITKDLKIIQEV